MMDRTTSIAIQCGSLMAGCVGLLFAAPMYTGFMHTILYIIGLIFFIIMSVVILSFIDAWCRKW